MAVDLTYGGNITVVETVDINTPAALTARKKVTHDQYNTAVTLSSTTTPPVTKMAAFEKALVAGAATIDLTALTGTNGATVDGTGLRVQALKFRNKSTNAAVMSIGKGAANAYTGFGATFIVQVPPGGDVTIYAKDGGADISGTVKNLDLVGTGTEVAEILIVMG